LLRTNERRGKHANDKKSKLPLRQDWLSSANSSNAQQTQSQSSHHWQPRPMQPLPIR
jgi:hypothetical protein